MEVKNLNYTILSNMDCLKKAWYSLNKTELEGGFPKVIVDGIHLHKLCEEYLKGGGYDHNLVLYNAEQSIFWTKIQPVLDGILERGLIHSERKIYRKLGGVPINGVVDVFENPRPGIIRDFKFTLKPWTPQKWADYVNKQGWLYFWLAEEELGEIPSKLIFTVCPLDGEVQDHVTPFVPESLEKAKRMWKAKWNKLMECVALDSWEPSPSAWNCRFCSYKNICEDSKA